MITRLAERGWLPDSAIRAGIRRLLRARLQAESARADDSTEESLRRFAEQQRREPIAVETQTANAQHYDVPAAFFRNMLGPRLKYSGGYWPSEDTTLADSEEQMLELTCQRAQLRDGMEVLDLGCGWGSLSLWIAERFPACRLLAVSNSNSQRKFIAQCCRSRGITNLQVETADAARFTPQQTFDRVVSVEMFEHLRNHAEMLRRVRQWLSPQGKLFLHVFSHCRFAYRFESNGRRDWMARHFFTGGMMPTPDLWRHYGHDMHVTRAWQIGGEHYARTCEAWLARLDAHRVAAVASLQQCERLDGPLVQLQRWRIFLMACAELFRYDQGRQWFVSHLLLEPTRPLEASMQSSSRPRSPA